MVEVKEIRAIAGWVHSLSIGAGILYSGTLPASLAGIRTYEPPRLR
jgi:hypothetical protein